MRLHPRELAKVQAAVDAGAGGARAIGDLDTELRPEGGGARGTFRVGRVRNFSQLSDDEAAGTGVRRRENQADRTGLKFAVAREAVKRIGLCKRQSQHRSHRLREAILDGSDPRQQVVATGRPVGAGGGGIAWMYSADISGAGGSHVLGTAIALTTWPPNDGYSGVTVADWPATPLHT